MEIIINRSNPVSTTHIPRQQPWTPPPGFRLGEKGRVKELHAKDNTVDVLCDSGIYLKRVPVWTKEWAIYQEDSEKEYNAGERDLPPLHSRVFIFMPTGSYDDCFIFGSLFSTPDKAKPFLDADVEKKRERIKEMITPSGWHITNDNDTGSHKAVSPDKKTSVEIDYGDKEGPKDKNPELHLLLFDEIKANVVIGEEDTIADISVFDDVQIEHKKGKHCYLKIFDTEIMIKKGLLEINHKGDYIETIEGSKTVTVLKDITIKAGGNILNSAGGINTSIGSSVVHN